ncbi:DNA-binding NarL/FixJ family response regulator [Actinomycetospora succinea]|uniref:DNA-binding NarL/FixJ family response regulator n=1 Tax=Actinomycetospora succinea TaxID=663603 RepID=A0A4R6UP11_9PSEU|nr:LuxR C-terminal-related transcriptional regulator [Actinomycetospora succinea]TDQ47369.1 DNA-binding NarL/FixJ family response regulator [Actinomycetospora succinea]
METIQREGEWLELVADLITRPLTRWPVDRILPMLACSFGAPAATFYAQDPGGPIDQYRWPADLYEDRLEEALRWGREQAPVDHPLLRYYLATGRAEAVQVADVPERFADHGVHERWRTACRDVFSPDVVAQASLPVCLTGGSNRSFLVGRPDPYSPCEMDQLRRLQRVFVGLDRQIAAHARWTTRTGPMAVPTAEEVGLTPRESVVLDMLATGATARAIARRLTVGERTVQKHLQRVYAKLGVADRLAAVQRAQLLGLLPPPVVVRT